MHGSGEYPDNWKKIAWAIAAMSHFHCEHCGHINDQESGHVLTVHHLDGNKSNCDATNLVALCQRCHLRIQAAYVPGQVFMFNPPGWAIVRGLHLEEDHPLREQCKKDMNTLMNSYLLEEDRS